MSSTLKASVFMVKNYAENWHSIRNTEDLTMKQMFDISEKLVSEQPDEIYGVKTINWENSSWKYLSLIGDEQVCLQRTKVHVFSDSVWCLGKMNENPRSNIAWEHRLAWFKKFTGIQNLGWNWSRANWIRVEYLPRIHHVAAQPQSSRVTVEIGWKTRKFYRTDYLRVDVQRHLMGSTDNKKECESNAQLVSLFAKKDLEQVKCHSSDLDQRKWYCMGADSPQGEWDRVAEKMMLEFVESGHPVFRATSPLSRGRLKKQKWWKIVDPLLCRFGNDVQLFFARLLL